MAPGGGFPGGSDGRESACSAGDLGLIPELERSGEGNGLPPPVLLPGESHGQRSLAGYSPWGRKESDTPGGLTLGNKGTHLRRCLLLMRQFWKAGKNDRQIVSNQKSLFWCKRTLSLPVDKDSGGRW